MPLKKVLRKSFLSNEVLETLLCNVESVINSRPLVYTSEKDWNESFMLYHLIYGTNIFQKTLGTIPKNLKGLPRWVKYFQIKINSYRNRFKSSYLNESRQQHLCQKSKKVREKLMVADIILNSDGKRIPRNQWKLGKVEELTLTCLGFLDIKLAPLP